METAEELLASLPPRPRGERHPRARLNDHAVRIARDAKRLDPNASVAAMARALKVSDTALRAALSGETWKHVK